MREVQGAIVSNILMHMSAGCQLDVNRCAPHDLFMANPHSQARVTENCVFFKVLRSLYADVTNIYSLPC